MFKILRYCYEYDLAKKKIFFIFRDCMSFDVIDILIVHSFSTFVFMSLYSLFSLIKAEKLKSKSAQCSWMFEINFNSIARLFK